MARTRISRRRSTSPAARRGVATARQVQGKELSYNNLNDTDAAFECVAEFEAPTVGDHQARQPVRRRDRADTLAEAWDKALALRSGLAFGGIVAVNRTLDAAAAEKIAAIFIEVIIAPDADAGGAGGPRAQEEPAPAAGRRPARSGGARADVPQRVRRLPGADPRQRPGRRDAI